MINRGDKAITFICENEDCKHIFHMPYFAFETLFGVKADKNDFYGPAFCQMCNQEVSDG